MGVQDNKSLPGPFNVVSFWVCIGFWLGYLEPEKELHWKVYDASARLHGACVSGPSRINNAACGLHWIHHCPKGPGMLARHCQ